HRLIEVADAHRRGQRALAIEDTHHVLGDDRLERHRLACTWFGEIVDVPPLGDQSEKGLIEAKHAFDRTMGQIMHGKKWMLLAPRAASVTPHAGKRRRTVATFLQLDEHKSREGFCYETRSLD